MYIVQQTVSAVVMIYLPSHVWGSASCVNGEVNQKLMPLPYQSSVLCVLPHSFHIPFKSGRRKTLLLCIVMSCI